MTGQELAGRTAIVTGGGSGIGRATSLRLASEGANVVVVDVDRDWGMETARIVEDAGGSVVFVPADVSRESEVVDAVSRSAQSFGRIRILVNNAGVAARIPITETTEEQWDRILDTNLKGAFLFSKHVLPHLIASGGGAIVNTASNAGLVGFAGLSAYGASKGGLIQLTRSLAVEYGDRNIRVNAVAPSSTRHTRMFDARIQSSPDPDRTLQALANVNPMRRLGSAEEVAELMLFLVSDRSSYITGGVFRVDGGLTAACPVPAF
jgi:NAD(P)-dependent dehydrogenase (short-subunit alcohol dehydrogenase family)